MLFRRQDRLPEGTKNGHGERSCGGLDDAGGSEPDRDHPLDQAGFERGYFGTQVVLRDQRAGVEAGRVMLRTLTEITLPPLRPMTPASWGGASRNLAK